MKDRNGNELKVGDLIFVGKKHLFHSTPQFPFIGMVEEIRETALDKFPITRYRPYMVVRVLKGVRMLWETLDIEPEYVAKVGKNLDNSDKI